MADAAGGGVYASESTADKPKRIARVSSSAHSQAHKRQGSSEKDGYAKLEPLPPQGLADIRTAEKGERVRRPGKYIARPHGTWGEPETPLSPGESDDGEGNSPGKGDSPVSDNESGKPLARLKSGVTSSSSAGGKPTGVLALKEWYSKRSALQKALSKSETPPKAKYIRRLVLSTWKHGGAGASAALSLIAKKTVSPSVVALKLLIVTHKLMQQGSPEVLTAAYSRLPFFQETASFWNRPVPETAVDPYRPLVAPYAAFVVEKAAFHHRFPAFESSYSVDLGGGGSLHGGVGASDPLNHEALACLQKMQDLLLKALEDGFAVLRAKVASSARAGGPPAAAANPPEGMSENAVGLVAAAIIPILREADLLYDVVWYLITSLLGLCGGAPEGPQGEALSAAIGKFGAQHRQLRSLFEQARGEPAIAQCVTPPALPADPPGFVLESPSAISASPSPSLRHSPHQASGAFASDDLSSKSASHSRNPSEELYAGPPHRRRSSEGAPPDVVEQLKASAHLAKLSFDSSDESGLSAVDETWLDEERSHHRSSGEGVPVGSPVVGGVGAAAAAALQRFQGQQAERARENQERSKSGPLPGPSPEQRAAARGGDVRIPGQYLESRLSGVDPPAKKLDDAWNPPAPVAVPQRTWEPPQKELQWSNTLPTHLGGEAERPPAGGTHRGKKNGWSSFDGDHFGGGSGTASPDMFSPVFQNVPQRAPSGADIAASPPPPEAMGLRPRSPPLAWGGDAGQGSGFGVNGANFQQQKFQGPAPNVPELSPFSSMNIQANGGEPLRLAQQTAASPPAQQFLSPQQPYPPNPPFQQQFTLPQYQQQTAQFPQYQQPPTALSPHAPYQQQATTPPNQFQVPPQQQFQLSPPAYQQPPAPPQQQYVAPVQYPPQFQQPFPQAGGQFPQAIQPPVQVAPAAGGQFQQAILPPAPGAPPQQQVVQLGQQLRVEKPPVVEPPWNQKPQMEAVASPLGGAETEPDSWTVPGSMSESSAWETFGENKQNKGDNLNGGAALQKPFQPQLPPPVQHRRSSSAENRLETVLPTDWEIPFAELTLGPKIGQGAFGDVLRATWQGTEVAIKRLQNISAATANSQAALDFIREVGLLLKLRHPNVILFMGACTAPPDLCIVMEFAANGSLYAVLRNPAVTIDMGTVLRWATETARGMNHLHTRTPAIVHRDLKSVNLLVDADWHIKVSDFGLARTKATSHAYTQVGTWGWMAPEVLDNAPYDEKADVYSYGVVLWELITREEPFKGMHPMQIMRAIDRGERPPMPENCPLAYRQLVTDCWQADPKGRPTFDVILQRLGAMARELQSQLQR